jgi:hypothetical protein
MLARIEVLICAMWKSAIVLLLAFAVMQSANAQESPPPAGWHRFESAEGRFVAYFPGSPRYAPDTRSQLKLPHRWVYTAKDGATYIAGYTDQLADQVAKVGPKDGLHEVSYLLGLDNAHQHGRLFTYSGYPAQQNQVRTPDFRFYRSRYLFVGNRLYFWAFVGSLDAVDGEDAVRMLSSFIPQR